MDALHRRDGAALGIQIYDTALFDPLWDVSSILHADEEKFFRPVDDGALETLRAEGHLAIHWHNNWTTDPAPMSLYARILRECSRSSGQSSG